MTFEESIKKFQSLEIEKQIDYSKFYLYSIITHSTAIEGSTVTEKENEFLFEKNIACSKPLNEIMMNLDLKNAYEKGFEYARKRINYSVPLLCELSSLVMKNTGCVYTTAAGEFSSSKGEIRKINVSSGRGGKSYMNYSKVETALEKFCFWLNEEKSKIAPGAIERAYDLSFQAHYNLVSIHPFADGNGRLSRLVMNMIQEEFSLPLSILKQDKKREYIEILEKADDDENVEIFTSWMKAEHQKNITQQINEYKKSIKKNISIKF